MMMKVNNIIESPQNEKIKYLNRLTTDNRFRKKEKVFIVEGLQENERALKFNFNAREFFICEPLFKGKIPNGKVHFISENLYKKLAYRENTEGILGIFETKKQRLEDFKPQKNASIIIVESIEKPGNLGAILRSCEAFGIDALIIADPKIDFYNPNVIRSSVGCLFGMNIFQANNQDTLTFLKNNHFNIYSTYMNDAAENIFLKDFKKKSAIIFGTEHSGISDFWTHQTENILIPMAGTIDSLNLSNAVAICCYEILKQKKS